MVTNLHTHNQVHELIFSLSFYVNFAVHLARLMALRKHTQPTTLRRAATATAATTMPTTEHLVLRLLIFLHAQKIWKLLKYISKNPERKIVCNISNFYTS